MDAHHIANLMTMFLKALIQEQWRKDWLKTRISKQFLVLHYLHHEVTIINLHLLALILSGVMLAYLLLVLHPLHDKQAWCCSGVLWTVC